MGAQFTCCIETKKQPLAPSPEEIALQKLLDSNPEEIVIKTVDEGNLLFEKNREKCDFLLRLVFNTPEEPYLFSKMLINLQYSHIYKRISLELGSFLSKETAECLIMALQSMNSLEFLELKLGENNEIEDSFFTDLSALLRNSICFGLKNFRLEISRAKITSLDQFINTLIERDALEGLRLVVRESNLNDEDFASLAKLLGCKNLKRLDLDLSRNNGQSAGAIATAIEKNSTLEKCELLLTENRFGKFDKELMNKAISKKPAIFSLDI